MLFNKQTNKQTTKQQQRQTNILPVKPAPAAPNIEVIRAMPAVDPRTAALPPPITAPTPVATRGAARPPVKPERC